MIIVAGDDAYRIAILCGKSELENTNLNLSERESALKFINLSWTEKQRVGAVLKEFESLIVEGRGREENEIFVSSRFIEENNLSCSKFKTLIERGKSIAERRGEEIFSDSDWHDLCTETYLLLRENNYSRVLVDENVVLMQKIIDHIYYLFTNQRIRNDLDYNHFLREAYFFIYMVRQMSENNRNSWTNDEHNRHWIECSRDQILKISKKNVLIYIRLKDENELVFDNKHKQHQQIDKVLQQINEELSRIIRY